MAILLCISIWCLLSENFYIYFKERREIYEFIRFPIFIQWLGLRHRPLSSIIWLRFLISHHKFFLHIFKVQYFYVLKWGRAKKPIKLELLYSLLNTWHFNISSVNQFIMWCNKLFWTASKLFNSITLGFFKINLITKR